MKNIKKLSIVKGALTLFTMFVSGGLLYAQDVILDGPAGCNAAANSGSWTVPCDVTSISVELYGGGGGAGGGGGGSNGGVFNTSAGGGGGGGGYSTITLNVIPGSVFSYSAAQGGCGGGNGSDFSDGDNGSSGGTSTFSGTDANGTSITLTAGGGVRGAGGNSGGSEGSGGGGGSASGGSTNTSGSAGAGGNNENGGSGGTAAGPIGGSGGIGNTSAGSNYGGGGAGGGNSAGGIGAEGTILITYVTQGDFTPQVVVAAASCLSDGTGTVSNYNPDATYAFTPVGPAVGNGGVVTGAVVGTSYTVRSTIGTCVSPASLSFSVEEQLAGPVISISGSLEYCVGSTATIVGGGGQSYSWDDTSNSTTASIDVGQGTYTVTGTDAAGCTGTSTVVVVEVANPSVNLGPDQEVCGQTMVTLDAGAGAVTYDWSSGDDTQTVELGSGTHWVEVSNGTCTASDTIDVAANSNPAPEISPSGDQTICEGGITTLDAGSGFTSYIWTPNGEQTESITVSQPASYSAYVTDALGCEGYSDTVVFTIQNIVDVLIAADGSLEICDGDSVTLDAGIGYDTYLWSNGDTTQTTAILVEGDFWVSGTLGGCSFESDTATVNVFEVIVEIEENGTVLSVPSTYTSYQWFLNGNPIVGGTSQSHSATMSGNYSVQVTDINGCTGLSYTLEYTLPSGVSELDAELPFTVYPNPNNGQFQLEMDLNGAYTVAVMNAVGQMVFVETNENGNRSFIDLKAKGIYLVEVVVENRFYHKRVIVQ